MPPPQRKTLPFDDPPTLVHVKGSRRVVEIHPAPNVTTFTLPDEGEDEEEKHKPTFLEVCWPTIFGLLLAVIAERLRVKVIRDWGAVGERLVFPWVLVASRPELGLGDTSTLAKMVLQLQFPLTGLYASWNLMRNHKLSTTIVQILFTYGIAAFVLWLLTEPGASHGM